MVMWRSHALRRGACGLVLAAALLASPTSAQEIVSNAHAELIRGLIPGVVNITIRIEVAVDDQRPAAGTAL
jgi:hypothetical protein